MTLVLMRGEQNLPIRLASAKSKLTVLLAQIRTELSDWKSDEKEKSRARAIFKSREVSGVVKVVLLLRYLRVRMFVM